MSAQPARLKGPHWANTKEASIIKSGAMLQDKSNRMRGLDVLEQAQAQARDILIVRHGRPAARWLALEARPTITRLGVTEGLFEAPDEIDPHAADLASLLGLPR